MTDAEKLIKMRQDLDEAKEKKARLEGEEEAAKKTLKNDFDCKDLKDAKGKLKTLDKEIEDLDEEIHKGVSDLEEKFNWN